MSDLIERLRRVTFVGFFYDGHEGKEDAGVCREAADEIERLQAQITSMTKDMESIKPWRELQRENEELHAALNADWGDGVMQENLKAKKELAAARRENEELREEKRQAKAIVQNQCRGKGSASILRWALAETFKEIAALKAKLQEAERDAARYRWLRDVMNDEIWVVNCTDEHLDAAIDAAMEQTK